jgi:hypothetical protein
MRPDDDPANIYARAKREYPDDGTARGLRYAALMREAGHVIDREPGDVSPLLPCGFVPPKPEPCVHELDPRTCSTCLHGVTPRPSPPREGCTRCQGEHCDAEILWCVTATRGKPIPIDPDPVDDGNILKVGIDAAGKRVVRYVQRGEETTGRRRYVAHFTTCPDADSFRRKK